MSEESKKVEKAEKTQQEVKPAELSEQDLEQVAGGSSNPVSNPVSSPASSQSILKGGGTIKF